MNISIFNRTTTQVSIVAPIYVENVKENEFGAIMNGYFIYGWHSELVGYTSLRREAFLEGDEIGALSPLGKMLTDEAYVPIERERFLELLAKAMTNIAGEEHT